MKNIVARGVTVLLGRHLQGLIPDIHLADIPLKHPEKFYETGRTIRCKVMSGSSHVTFAFAFNSTYDDINAENWCATVLCVLRLRQYSHNVKH